ncbi:MAG: enoyl-CoA hydratase [Candidatus Eremiobacteraeota bacterium]|nr:enoyl-CoA hydratase [Candidatus Eremiobacteraeota bacterium]
MLDTQASSGTIDVSVTDQIATITLANAKRRNPLSLATMRELLVAFEDVGRNAQVRVVVLAALGPAFSAGHDLREMQCAGDKADVARFREIFDACVRVMQTMQMIPQPVIAEIAGVATAAGAQLVATCDLALASTQATFATPGVKIGLFCTTPMVALTRTIGRKRAMEMLLTGDFIDAATAERWGLINRVVEPDRLHDEVLALAKKIVGSSSFTVGLGKAAFYAQVDLDQAKAYAYAKEVMTVNALDADAREGIGAFLERRSPDWKR